jgi:hypothetical protein
MDQGASLHVSPRVTPKNKLNPFRARTMVLAMSAGRKCAVARCLMAMVCLLPLVCPTRLAAEELSESDKFFLADYEKMRAALAADDLARSNEVAAELTADGFPAAKSETLERARAEFVKLSETAITTAAKQPGYYVVHCPMLNRDWVQTSKQISNPYGGKDLLTCGQIKE